MTQPTTQIGRPRTRFLVVDPFVGIVTVLTLVALALRVIGLNSQLWYDEIYSLVMSSRLPLREILTTYCGDIQHPLNSLLVNISISALGESPWTVRLPAVIFGVASIPLIFLVARDVANEREGLLAAAFLAVSYHHIWFSQNSRGYTSLLFWTLLCTLLFYRGLGHRRWKPFLAYSFAAAVGAYTHATFVFVVIGHAAVTLLLAAQSSREGWDGRRWLAKPITAIVLSGVLTIAFYAPILGQMMQYYRQRSGQMRAVSTPGWALLETVRGLELGLGSQLMLVLAASLVGLGLWGYWKENRLAFLMLVSPTAAAGLGVIAMRGSMYPRYLFLLVGFGILIVVRGAMVLGAMLGRLGNPLRDVAIGQMIGVGCMVLATIGSATTLGGVYRHPKQDFSGALQFIESERRAAEPVLTAGAAAWPYQHYYGRDWPKLEDPKQIESMSRQSRRVWLVYTFPRYIEDETPGLMDAIQRSFKTIRVFPGTLGHAEVFVCVKDSAESASL